MTSRCPPHMIGQYTKKIEAAARKLARHRASAARAEEEFRASIIEAFEAGLSVDPIRRAAGIGKDRAYQIKHGRR